MLDLRWGLAASSNFTQSVICILEREETQKLLLLNYYYWTSKSQFVQRETSDICLSWKKTVNTLLTLHAHFLFHPSIHHPSIYV